MPEQTLKRQRLLCGAAVVVSLGAVGAALFTQYRMGMQPCPWCVLQRVIFIAIALAALPGLLLPFKPARWASAGLMLVLAGCGAAAALWQHFVAASSTSCAMTLADRLVRGYGLDEMWPEGFSATASCAEAAINLLGVPYAFWSLTLFVMLLVVAVQLLRLR